MPTLHGRIFFKYKYALALSNPQPSLYIEQYSNSSRLSCLYFTTFEVHSSMHIMFPFTRAHVWHKRSMNDNRSEKYADVFDDKELIIMMKKLRNCKFLSRRKTEDNKQFIKDIKVHFWKMHFTCKPTTI